MLRKIHLDPKRVFRYPLKLKQKKNEKKYDIQILKSVF